MVVVTNKNYKLSFSAIHYTLTKHEQNVVPKLINQTHKNIYNAVWSKQALVKKGYWANSLVSWKLYDFLNT